MMDYAKECATFHDKLEQAREKLINQWAGDEVQRFKDEMNNSNSKFLQKALEKKANHEENLKNLRQKCKEDKKALHDHLGKVRALHEEMKQVDRDVEEANSQQLQLQQDLEAVDEDIDREKELLSAQEKAVREKLGELEKASVMFQDRLGIKFKKTTGGKMQVSFQRLDDKDPDARFLFSVQINDGKYVVSGCEPPVEDMDQLIEKLNTTNNFRSFVIALRKAFKASLKN